MNRWNVAKFFWVGALIGATYIAVSELPNAFLGGEKSIYAVGQIGGGAIGGALWGTAIAYVRNKIRGV